MECHGIVNNKRVLIAKSITQLKRLASRYANNTFNAIDTLRVNTHNEKASVNIDTVTFHRFNKIAPNNTIIRGEWR